MAERIIRVLFILGVIAIPFDAIAGIGAFGELSGEASFYLFTPAILLHLATVVGRLLREPDAIGRPSFLGWVTIALMGVLLANAVSNLPVVLQASFHERSGINKLITSSFVLVYGLLLARLAAATLPGRWDALLVKPVGISALICIGFSLMEGLNRAGLPLPFYAALNGFVHAGSDNLIQSWNGAINVKLLEGWDQRLRSVSFEPPAFGNFTGYAWPWLLCGVLAATGRQRVLRWALLIAFTALILASQARTGQLLLAANLVAFVALRYVYAPPNGRPNKPAVAALTAMAGAGAIAGVALAVSSVDGMAAGVVRGESVSDLTRLAYQLTAFSMFADHPLDGVGMGQFAFHAINFMPAWGYFSPEVAASMIQPAAPWPNTYSLYARLAAETGFVGLGCWIALWLTTIVLVIRAATAHARRHGALPVVTYPIVMNALAVLVSAVTTDTFRTPMIWIGLGAAAAALAAVRRRARG
jgi:hypothetical protein